MAVGAKKSLSGAKDRRSGGGPPDRTVVDPKYLVAITLLFRYIAEIDSPRVKEETSEQHEWDDDGWTHRSRHAYAATCARNQIACNKIIN